MQAKIEGWTRTPEGHKESAASAKSVVSTQMMHQAWPELLYHILLQPSSPTMLLPCLHQRRKSICRDHGGSGLCEHQRVRRR